MKIGIAMMSHETNTFSPVITDLSASLAAMVNRWKARPPCKPTAEPPLALAAI